LALGRLGASGIEAISYALLVGEHAVGLRARAEATIHYEMEFSMADEQGDSKEMAPLLIDAALKLASVGASSKDLARDGANLQRVEATGDKARLSKVLYWLGRHAYVGGGIAAAAIPGQESLELADSLHDEQLAAPAVNLVGRLSILQCKYVRGTALMVRSTAQMRALGDKLEEATAAGFCSSLLAFRGLFAEALEYANLALGLAQELKNPFAKAATYFNRGLIFSFGGEWTRCHADYDQCRELSQRIGDPFRIYIVDVCQCWAFADSGRSDLGLPLGERALAASEQLSTTFMIALAKAGLAACLLDAGERDKAITLSQDTVQTGKDTSYRTGSALANRTLAQILSQRGDDSGAVRNLEYATSLFEELGME